MSRKIASLFTIGVLVLLLLGLALETQAVPSLQEPTSRPDLFGHPEGPAFLDTEIGPLGVGKLVVSTYVPASKIVYQSYRDNNWEIYTANDDGSQETRLTFHNAPDIHPRFNRGCTRIVFASKRSGNYDIWVMNADGSGLAQLTTSSKDDVFPAWSPDGSRIAFTSYRDDQPEVYVMNADGSGQTRLTWEAGYDGMPVWSPDGNRIAFVSNRSGGYRIWVMNADGSEQRSLSEQPYSESPTWSPDGSKIAYDADGDGDGWQELWLMNADGTGQHEIFDAGTDAVDTWARSWSPDGRYLALTRIQYVYYQGQWYWTSAFVEALDSTQPWWTFRLIDYGLEWHPDWQTADIWPPESYVLPLPAQSPGPFTVAWTGSDTGPSGLRNYDVQVREGDGPWTDWITGTTATSASYPGIGGHTYAFRCRARDYGSNVEPWPPDYDAVTTVEAAPPRTEIIPLPAYHRYRDQPLYLGWEGEDPGGSGIAFYDVQYRELPSDPWSPLVSETTDLWTSFFGAPGHRYAFRSRGTDNAQNVEPWPSNVMGDTWTTFYTWAIGGVARDTRDVPLPGVFVTTTPSAFETNLSDMSGAYSAYVAEEADRYLAVWGKAGYGNLPSTSFSSTIDAQVDIFLPPADNLIRNGDFETGKLEPDWVAGGVLTPSITTFHHTGEYGVRLGCQGTFFSTPFLIAGPSGWPNTPIIALDDSHNVHLIWVQTDGSGWQEIYYARRHPDGTWTAPQQISNNHSYAGSPALAAEGDGVAHVVWIADRGAGNYDVLYAQRTSDGNWSAPQNISNSPAASYGPVIILGGSETVHVFWLEGGPCSNTIYHTYKVGDGPWSNPQDISHSSRGAAGFQIAIGAEGTLHVAWEDNPCNYGEPAEVFYAQRTSDGTWSSPQNVSNNATWSHAPRIAIDTAGTVHLVWRDTGGLGQAVDYAWRQSNGSWSTPTVVFSTASVWEISNPDLAADEGGSLHLVVAQRPSDLVDQVELEYLYKPLLGPWSGPVAVARQIGWIEGLEIAASPHTVHIIESGRFWDEATAAAYSKLLYLRRESDGVWSTPIGIIESLQGDQAITFGMAIEDEKSVHVAWWDPSNWENRIYYAQAASNETTGDSVISQTITTTLAMSAPTLSFLYQLHGASDTSGSWLSILVDDGLTVTALFSTTLSRWNWTHVWMDMSAWAGQTITLTFSVHQTAGHFCTWGYLDEVSWGSAYPDLWVREEGPGDALPGQVITYSLIYGNRGGVTATGVLITDTLPAGLAFVAAEPVPISPTTPLRWDVGDLPAWSGPRRIVLTVMVAPTTTIPSVLTGTVYIGSALPEIETADNALEYALFVGYRVYLPLVMWRYSP